jgi:hypothetical protein
MRDRRLAVSLAKNITSGGQLASSGQADSRAISEADDQLIKAPKDHELLTNVSSSALPRIFRPGMRGGLVSAFLSTAMSTSHQIQNWSG